MSTALKKNTLFHLFLVFDFCAGVWTGMVSTPGMVAFSYNLSHFSSWVGRVAWAHKFKASLGNTEKLNLRNQNKPKNLFRECN